MVVATAATGEQGVELFRQHRPDITLMDLRLPTMSGLDACGRSVGAPQTRESSS